jgi:hypothetical protein
VFESEELASRIEALEEKLGVSRALLHKSRVRQTFPESGACFTWNNCKAHLKWVMRFNAAQRMSISAACALKQRERTRSPKMVFIRNIAV